MSSPVFNLNLGTPLSGQADNVEEQHLQQLARQIQPSPLQPQQHDSPLHQSPQQRSVIQPYTASTGLTPQSLMQPQTPAGHVHSGSSPSGGASAAASGGVGIFPATPGPPMTPITPASADPGIVPQLQYVLAAIFRLCSSPSTFHRSPPGRHHHFYETATTRACTQACEYKWLAAQQRTSHVYFY